MASFGAGFGEALGKNVLAEREAAVREKELGLKEKKLGLEMSALDAEISAKRMAAAQGMFEASVKRMDGFFNAVKELGPQFKAGSALDKAIDQEKLIMATIAGKVGIDPNVAEAMATKVRSAAQIPKTERLAPGGSLVQHTATGVQTLASAPTAKEQDIKSLETSLGRPLSEPERLSMSGATPKDPLKAVMVNGIPTFMRESEISKSNAQPIISGLDVTVGPDGTVKVTQGPQGGSKLPATAAAEFKIDVGELKSGEQDIDKLLKMPSGTFGMLGSVKKTVRETGRIAGELAVGGLPKEVAGPIQNMANLVGKLLQNEDSETQKAFGVTDMTEANSIETRLAYLYARSLQPTGKLLADTIKTAKSATELFGLKSEATVREKLMVIREGLQRARENIEKSTNIPSADKGKSDVQFRFNPSTGKLEPVK